MSKSLKYLPFLIAAILLTLFFAKVFQRPAENTTRVDPTIAMQHSYDSLVRVARNWEDSAAAYKKQRAEVAKAREESHQKIKQDVQRIYSIPDPYLQHVHDSTMRVNGVR